MTERWLPLLPIEAAVSGLLNRHVVLVDSGKSRSHLIASPSRLGRGDAWKIRFVDRIDGRQGCWCGVCWCSLARTVGRHGGDDSHGAVPVPVVPSLPIGTVRGGIHRPRRPGAPHDEMRQLSNPAGGRCARGRAVMVPPLGVEREFQPRVQLGPGIVVLGVPARHAPASYAFEIAVHVERRDHGQGIALVIDGCDGAHRLGAGTARPPPSVVLAHGRNDSAGHGQGWTAISAAATTGRREGPTGGGRVAGREGIGIRIPPGERREPGSGDVVRDHVKGNVDIDDDDSEHQDPESKKGREACQRGQGEDDDEEEGHHQPVGWIKDSHGDCGGGRWVGGELRWEVVVGNVAGLYGGGGVVCFSFTWRGVA